MPRDAVSRTANVGTVGKKKRKIPQRDLGPLLTGKKATFAVQNPFASRHKGRQISTLSNPTIRLSVVMIGEVQGGLDWVPLMTRETPVSRKAVLLIGVVSPVWQVPIGIFFIEFFLIKKNLTVIFFRKSVTPRGTSS